MCWLIKLIHKYGAFSRIPHPMPPSDRARLKQTRSAQWQSFKAIGPRPFNVPGDSSSSTRDQVPCTGRAIPGHVKRSQTCRKSRGTIQSVVYTHTLYVQRSWLVKIVLNEALPSNAYRYIDVYVEHQLNRPILTYDWRHLLSEVNFFVAAESLANCGFILLFSDI